MTTTHLTTPGLRERQRLATRRSIQVAVLQLLDERGIDGVTVDEISRMADVSPRTFFNYFGSKEEAMLGDAPELPEQEVIDEFLEGRGALLDDLSLVLRRAGEHAQMDPEMLNLRHRLLKQLPHLFAMRMATMRAFEESVAEIVALRLARDEPALAADPDARASKARLVTLVAFAAMRHAWTSWAHSPTPTVLADQLAESFAQLKSLVASEPA
ncbi:TetR family transcriptional regulator [soil metagenome]